MVTVAPYEPQRFNASGRLEPVTPTPAAIVAPASAVGFTIAPLAHGMAELRDPRGNPCGQFASGALASRTLSTLAFLLRDS